MCSWLQLQTGCHMVIKRPSVVSLYLARSLFVGQPVSDRVYPHKIKMEPRRLFAGSVLIFLAFDVAIVRGLSCICTDVMDWKCVINRVTDCGDGEECAIVFERDRNGTSGSPNTQQMCSGKLPPGACSGDLNNETHFIACCNYSRCTERESFNPVYRARATTANILITETTDAARLIVADSDTGNPRSSERVYIGIIVGIPCLLVAVLLLMLLFTYVYYRRLKREVRKPPKRSRWDNLMKPEGLSVHIDYKGTIPRVEEGTSTCSSGSGSGMPLLTQRTVARTIKLGDRIGSGRFGQVFLGDYQDEKVAVKKFVSHDDKSWARETEIYNTVFLIHNNILGFFASDMVSNNGVTELWLITEYHPNGSLYDYLNREVISPQIMLRMINSCCCGLSHLHTEVPGTYCKPAIAHRDIKSRNILVKQNLECCIADFGLAVMKDDNGLSLPTNPRQGTKRYMAPEILNETINMNRFESFKQADVYSLGLVMWEICRRCTLKDGIALDYELPFQGLVPSDPSFEEMKRLVVVERRQPSIPDEWLKDVLLQRLSQVMQECWHFDGVARPTAVNLKKKMTRLSEQNQNQKTDTSIE